MLSSEFLKGAFVIILLLVDKVHEEKGKPMSAYGKENLPQNTVLIISLGKILKS